MLSLAIRIGKNIIDIIGRLLSTLRIRATYSENLAASRSIISKFTDYNILDKASILLTPTAYSDARVHSVKTYTGDELVVNGTYDTDLSGWTNTSTHWQWSSGSAYHPLTTSFLPLKQTITNNVGAVLRITFDLTYVQGTAQCFYKNEANSDVATTFTSSGSYTIITEPVKANTEINFGRAFGYNTEFYIDNVSVVDVSSDFDFDRASSATRINFDGLVQDMQSITDPELVLNGDFEELGDDLVTNGTFDTDSGWTKGTGWSISNGNASYDGSGTGYQYIIQGITTISGGIYKINFDVLSSTGSNLNIVDFGSVRVNQTHLTEGNYTYYAQADASSENLTIYANGTDTFSIDNVSIQQVDPNDRWTVTDSDADNYVEFTEGFARLKFLNTSPVTNFKTSNSVLEGGKTYELVVDVHDVTSGSIKIDGNGISEIFDTEGVTTRYITPIGNATLSFYRASANVDITFASVSLKDITFSTDVDLARINYDSNGENGHWLLEPTSTNEITYSQDLSQWTSNDVTVTDNNAISPDGTQNASKIELDSGTSIKRISLSSMPTSSVNRSFSVFIKANSDFTGAIQLVHSGDLQGFANFDLSDGTVGSTGSKTTANIVSYANDWYRCTAIFDSTNTFASTVYLWVQDNDSGSYGGSTSATGSIFAYGFQYEALPYATSYIPSLTGSTVTRAEETLTGSGNSTLINSTEGVLYAEIAALSTTDASGNISLSDGTGDNRIYIYYLVDDAISVIHNINSSGAVINNFTLSDITSYTKIATRWGNSKFSVWINGAEVLNVAASNFTSNTLDLLNLAKPDGTGQLEGKVKALAVFDEVLTDDELELLTGVTNYGSFSELAQANGYTII